MATIRELEAQAEIESVDLEFVRRDFPKLISSMKTGQNYLLLAV